MVSSVNTTIDVPRRDISGVRSGRAESFDPSALHVPPPTPGRSEGADSKGLFVDRAARDVLIIEVPTPLCVSAADETSRHILDCAIMSRNWFLSTN